MSEKKQRPQGICDNCTSKNYCKNMERGVLQCINYNKFPAETK